MLIQTVLEHVKPINTELTMIQSHDIIKTLYTIVELNNEYISVLEHYVESLCKRFPKKGVLLMLDKDDVVDKDLLRILHILKYTQPKNAENLLEPALRMCLTEVNLRAYQILLINKMIQGDYKSMLSIIQDLKEGI